MLDVLKSQRNPIFKVVVAILKNTNFFRVVTTFSSIPAIYIHQFWDTMRYDSTTGIYSCQLDEQWFNLHKDILKDVLQITPINDNNPFVAPPSSDAVIEYVNTLGYPCMLRNVSAMSINDLYQPWRAILSMINMCLTEFVQSIQTFLTEKNRLIMALLGKKKYTPLLIPSIIFTKLIIHHLKTKHNIHPRTGSPLYYSHEDNVLGTLRSVGKDGRELFGMLIPDALLTDAIKRAPYYDGYLAHVVEYQRYLDGECSMAEEEAIPKSPKATKVTKPKATMQTKPSAPKVTKVTKPAGDKAPKSTSSQPPKPTPTPTKSSKEVQGKVPKKRKSKSPLKLVDEFVDKGVLDKELAYNDEESNLQRAMELSLKEQEERTHRPARLVVFREPDSGRFQPLLERRNPMTTKPSRNAESPSLDAELALADSETESDEPDISMAKDTEMEVIYIKTPVTTTGVQVEGQGGSDLSKAKEVMKTAEAEQTIEEQIHEEFTTTMYPNVQDNLKLPAEEQVILEEPASSTGTLSSLHQLDKDFNFSDQFLNDKSSDAEKEKTHAKAEVESMVTVTIQQDTSSVPPMTFKVIDLPRPRLDDPNVHSPLSSTILAATVTTTTITTSTITTATTPTVATTTPLLPPSQPPQSQTDTSIESCLNDTFTHIADLMQCYLPIASNLDGRIDNHASRLSDLENLNISHKVKVAVDEVVTDTVN
ncbi:retrovirus-related pol polyprotein from transposon TNT 1-94 [Tanacetum coccineum]|uniref:Retrovirus-related pol polyprotein from transposon TNT 1-94 n=1 Tax=Tanacetum coccineum TaxID=301880 RepID=A0ABQ5BLV9_9ASTR